MKNKIFGISIIIFIIILFNTLLLAENIFIESKNISLDKNKKISIFENEVIIKTKENSTIKSEYAEYNKNNGLIKLKDKITIIDKENNKVETNYAEYNEKTKIFKSIGPTKIITSENYIVNTEDVTFDDYKNFISSKKNTSITDLDNNKIYLENFDFLTKQNIFKSIGFIRLEDNNKNSYEFSQIYIDTKKKEILGTDIKAFMNSDDFKTSPKNKPRVFANTINVNKERNVFNKSIFTLCDYRKNDKCPPWSIQSTKMLHDRKKKTIYYDNAVIKVYDFPVFYFPKLSHPDPTVERRSGFLPPSISDSKNLGSGISIPYFFAVNKDKNFTLTNRIYATENPLFLGEYHQAFKNSNLFADFGFTEGYKKTNNKKIAGDKSHFFSKFTKNFKGENNSDNTFNLTVEDVSNDKYLKLYKIKSDLIDYNRDTLENSLNFSHNKDDLFIGIKAGAFETLKSGNTDKYEYILPDVTLDKNLFNNELGSLDLQTNYKVHNYDTNKLTNFLVNDFDWAYKELSFNSGLNSKILGKFKNINYEAKNVDLYKKDTTSEMYGAVGLLTDLKLQKKLQSASHFLTPKILFRFSPGNMRKETENSTLNPITAFSMNRLNNINNFETGLSSTIGFDYKINRNNKDFDFSVAQIINEKENKKMPTKTSLDEKLSDLVGSASYEINDKINLNYNFNIDQNYNDINYNELGAVLDFDNIKIDFDYLKENKHIGDQEYFKTKIDFAKNDNGVFSFETKRNLVKNSSEFYNLSYEYINDCLKAGLVYRREFYNDSELEPENSLMFKITLTPFGNINSPLFSQ
jgi:LPS-assembly protein